MMRLLRRLIHINYVLVKHGLDQLVPAAGWFSIIRLMAYLNPWNWFRCTSKTRGMRIRDALEELGPIFVKFGQMLSTRPDLIPTDIIFELKLLQDKVKPFNNVEKVMSNIYGSNFKQLFATFEMEPLAAASVAQVHAATLHNGNAVVVKILRPQVDKKIKRDIQLLIKIATYVERYWTTTRRFKPKELVHEFERSLMYELDLMREAGNASQLSRNFKNSRLLYVPEVHWQLCRDKAIVLEQIHGIPIVDIEALQQQKFNMKKLAERGVEIFFTQVFRDCFFHADMHPGNIFVNPDYPDDPQYIAVDFGIVGTLNPRDQRYLAENMLAFFKRDYRKVAELHIRSRWVHPSTKDDEFESAIRTVCEPIFERPLKDISCGQLLLRLIQTGKQFQMEIQPQLLLLQKTLLHIEGLGRLIYPDLDLWSTARPFLEKWLRKRIGYQSLGKNLFKSIPYILEKAPEIPELLYQTLSYFKQQEIRQFISTEEIYQKKATSRKMRRSGFTLGFSLALIFSGIIHAMTTNKFGASGFDSASTSMLLLITGSVVLILYYLFQDRRG